MEARPPVPPWSTGEARTPPEDAASAGRRAGVRLPAAPARADLAAQDEEFRLRALWRHPLTWLSVGAFWLVGIFLSALEIHAQDAPGLAWPGEILGAVLSNISWMVVCVLTMSIAVRVPLSRRTLPGLLCVVVGMVIVRGLLYDLQNWLMPGAPLTLGLAVLVLPSNLVMVSGFLALGYGVKHYLATLRRERTATRLEAQLAGARLEMLQRQLHPHFLFNSLNTVSALLRRDADAAAGTLLQLEQLLRLALDRADTPTVTLRDELAATSLFLAIEQRRFADRLRVEVEVDDEAAGAHLPPLLLQPLVENAIRHGVAPRPGPMRVGISARRRGGWLEVEVSDTGAGPPPGWSLERSAGLGLRITADRLRTLYGDRFALTVRRAAPEGGTVVVLRVPA
ncbi:MAG TPA: histidine kinase [Longimicrobium sp.]|nr:histidine kinase [Longimicrobium sp.]